MGEQFNSVLLDCDPSKVDFEVQGFKLPSDVGAHRLSQRRNLLQKLESSREISADQISQAAKRYSTHAEMAYSMLHQKAFRDALDLQRISAAIRRRYGYSKFGQSLLLARQLVEAGISLVTVNFDHESKHDKRSPMWDTHHDNFAKLKNPLCPLFDHTFSVFLEDLSERGLLDSTMVVATGEFGRTPKVGQFSQNAMTLKTGRDHWPHAFTSLLAGGGVPGGQAYGSTTTNGGYVADKPVSPADLAATMLHHLGVDTSQQYDDHFQHLDHAVCEGRPIRDFG
jgi:uncharacterized protein (DUF1501 family)